MAAMTSCENAQFTHKFGCAGAIFCDGAKLRCAWPAPDSETVGSAKLRNHEHEKKTEGIFFTHHALIFSRTFQ